MTYRLGFVFAAALWMIKRVKADGWTQAAALEEANALGLNVPSR